MLVWQRTKWCGVLWWYLELQSGVLSACRESPFCGSPSQILNQKTQSHASQLVSSWELFGDIHNKDSKAFPMASKALYCRAPGYLCSNPILNLAIPLTHWACSCLRAFSPAAPFPWNTLLYRELHEWSLTSLGFLLRPSHQRHCTFLIVQSKVLSLCEYM